MVLEETNERLRMRGAKRLLLLIPHKSQLKEDMKYNRKEGENREEAKTIT